MYSSDEFADNRNFDYGQNNTLFQYNLIYPL